MKLATDERRSPLLSPVAIIGRSLARPLFHCCRRTFALAALPWRYGLPQFFLSFRAPVRAIQLQKNGCVRE
jgi:hypothetical protein